MTTPLHKRFATRITQKATIVAMFKIKEVDNCIFGQTFPLFQSLKKEAEEARPASV
jgi:hypothetical protein